MITDRMSGAFFFLLGLALYFYVIPNFVDQIDYGSLYPDTLPNALSIILAVCGAGLVAKPTNQGPPDASQMARAALFLLVLALGVWAMSVVGFVYTAAPLALVLSLMIGERRPHWLIIGVVVVPFLVWATVDLGLDRALP